MGAGKCDDCWGERSIRGLNGNGKNAMKIKGCVLLILKVVVAFLFLTENVSDHFEPGIKRKKKNWQDTRKFY